MMKNKTLSFLLATLLSTTLAQGQVKVSGTLQYDCPNADSIFILEHDGIALVKLQSQPLRKTEDNQATFEFNFTNLPVGFYFIGVQPNNVKALILGNEKEVVLQGSCNTLPQAQVQSPHNQFFFKAFATIQQLDQRFNQQANRLRQAGNNADQVKQVAAEMAKIDADRLQLLDEAMKQSSLLGNFVGLYTFVSFINNQGNYTNEVEFFGNEFFSKINLGHPDFLQIPFLFDRVRQYTQTLAGVNQPNSVQQAFSNRLLSTVPPGSRTHKCVLAGIMQGYQQANNQNLFAFYGEQYLKFFGNQNPDVAANLKQQVQQAKAFAIGGEAPNFSMKTPEGNDLSLYDLRGKVVLVDFWASWCGPCRKANPEVVALYNRYKEKGFDVLGVSLDRTRDPWLAAIEKDGLKWHHVSDLKGWQNAAAQLYNVTSIPHTLLLDKEGKIIAHNLRGNALESKLKEIFGE